MSADDEQVGAVAASELEASAVEETAIAPPVTDAEPPTEIVPDRVVVDPALADAAPVATPEPVLDAEPVTDKRPTFEPIPAAPSEVPLGSAPSSPTAERPELLVGVAFAGGLVAALILKRLGR